MTIPDMLASQMAEQLGRDRNICSALQTIQFQVMDMRGEASKAESTKNRIIEAIGKARPGVEVVFADHFAPMPGSMDEISVSIQLPTLLSAH
jgi:hypothetical protein